MKKEFFVQLFFEIDQTQYYIPETEKLLAQMFLEQNISFTKVSKQYVINYNDFFIYQIPSKLLLQMPRFGKDFKLYNRMIPSLTLDVKPILDKSKI